MEWIGHRFGNYRLLRFLGEGGYAQVYLGKHVLLGTQAAIKVLHAHLGEREIERFCQEASAVARLAHPNIVRLLEFDVTEGVPYLVMEYAPGGTLRQRHPQGVSLALHTILPYVKQTAAALGHAHAHQLIHRDVKPDNLLLGRDQYILLGDFGLAILTQSSSNFKTQEVIGTVAYMAPEQIEGHPCPASDQYALAILVYEWLTGERPFIGSLVQVIAQQVLATPRTLRDRVPTISPDVEAVVLRALAKDPKARFATVEAFAASLEAAAKASHLTGPRTSSVISVRAPGSDHVTRSPAPTASQPALSPAQQPSPQALGEASLPSLVPDTSDVAQARHRLSRRELLTGLGLAGVVVTGVVVAGGIGWRRLLPPPQAQTRTSQPTIPSAPASTLTSGPGSGVSLVTATHTDTNVDFSFGAKLEVPTVQAGDFLLAVVGANAGANGTPSNWTMPPDWTAGANGADRSQTVGQELVWWWKIASRTEPGTIQRIQSDSFAEGGAVCLNYRGYHGIAARPILGVSSLAINNGSGNGQIISATCPAVSWSGSRQAVSLILLNWQPNSAIITWPSGYGTDAITNTGFSFVAVGSNLASQAVSSLTQQTVSFSAGQVTILALQIALLV